MFRTLTDKLNHVLSYDKNPVVKVVLVGEEARYQKFVPLTREVIEDFAEAADLDYMELRSFGRSEMLSNDKYLKKV